MKSVGFRSKQLSPKVNVSKLHLLSDKLFRFTCSLGSQPSKYANGLNARLQPAFVLFEQRPRTCSLRGGKLSNVSYEYGVLDALLLAPVPTCVLSEIYIASGFHTVLQFGAVCRFESDSSDTFRKVPSSGMWRHVVR
jgi:hypothetical protein